MLSAIKIALSLCKWCQTFSITFFSQRPWSIKEIQKVMNSGAESNLILMKLLPYFLKFRDGLKWHWKQKTFIQGCLAQRIKPNDSISCENWVCLKLAKLFLHIYIWAEFTRSMQCWLLENEQQLDRLLPISWCWAVLC